MNTATTNFTTTLRQWRKQRKVSQLELALAAEVSQRHISWLETGRSQPSREMVVKLSEALDIPLRDRNHLLNTAGFANLYSQKSLDEPAMAPITDMLKTMLEHHEPYPAYVVDRYWNIKMKNQAANLMFEVAGSAEDIWKQVDDNGEHNIARLMLHPNGLRHYIQNWSEIISPFVKRLKEEVNESDDLQIISRFNELASYINESDLCSINANEELRPVLPIIYGKGQAQLSLYSIISTFGTAQDITANELRIESFYPSDKQTAKFFTE